MLILNLYRFENQNNGLITNSIQIHNPVINGSINMWEIESGRIKVHFNSKDLEIELLKYRDHFAFGKVIDTKTDFEFPFYIDTLDYFPSNNLIDIKTKDLKLILDIDTRLDFSKKEFRDNEDIYVTADGKKITVYNFKEIGLKEIVKEINNSLKANDLFAKKKVSILIDPSIDLNSLKIKDIGEYKSESIITSSWRLLKPHLIYNELYLKVSMDDDCNIKFEIKKQSKEEKGLLVDGLDKLKTEVILPFTNHTVASIKYNNLVETYDWKKIEESERAYLVEKKGYSHKITEVDKYPESNELNSNNKKVYRLYEIDTNEEFKFQKDPVIKETFTEDEVKDIFNIELEIRIPEIDPKDASNFTKEKELKKIKEYFSTNYFSFNEDYFQWTNENTIGNVKTLVAKAYINKITFVFGSYSMSSDPNYNSPGILERVSEYKAYYEVKKIITTNKIYKHYFICDLVMKSRPRPELKEIHYYMDIDGKIYKTNDSNISIPNMKYPIYTRYFEDKFLANAQIEARWQLMKYKNKYAIEWEKNKNIEAKIYDFIKIQMRNETANLQVIGYKFKNYGDKVNLTYMISDSFLKVFYIVSERNEKIITGNSKSKSETNE